MADSRQEIGDFYRRSRVQALRLAFRLGARYPEDAVQAAIVMWLARKNPGRIDMACFERQLRLVLYTDYTSHNDGKRFPRPTEVHGDIDRLFRSRHGRRTGPKKGAE